MSKFVNIADLDSGNGKSYRKMNREKVYKFSIGQLVEIDNGVRLFVAYLKRDCDETPLYALTPESKTDGYPLNEIYWTHGYSEDGMKLIK